MRRINITFTICLALLLLFGIFTIILPIQNCSASETIHVYEGESIQDAINSANASGGDTIYVHSGYYSTTITIDRPLTLTGDGSGSTIISGSGDHTIKVTANNVQISEVKIQNTGGSYYCVFMSTVTGCEISNSNVRNGGHGIYLHNSNSNTIEDNTIEDNNVGIYLFSSDSNTIKSNNIQNNDANGIWLTSTCNSNTIYLNDFYGHPDGNAKDYGSNNWDYNSQGNYWDDYNDYDSDQNGIGDNPYSIEGVGNQDNYPLGDFLSLEQDPVAYIDSITPNPAIQGDTVYFSGHGTDADGSITAWEWKANGAIIGTSGDISKSDFLPVTYTINFRVKDNDDNWSPSTSTTLVITSPNQKPNAYILEPTTSITKQYGDPIEFLGDYSDDGSIIEYNWRSSIDGTLSSSIGFTKSDLTLGQHTIYFKVRDDDGEWSDEVSIGVTIVTPDPSNNPPVADAGGSYTGYVNQSVTFDGSGSSDPDDGDSITSYQWDFGDGTTGEGVTAQHNYTSLGSYTVELTVIDSNGEQATSTASVTILKEKDQNGDNGDGDNGSPGFEVFLVVIGIGLILFYRRKTK